MATKKNKPKVKTYNFTAEQLGERVTRVLPSAYLWFSGDGVKNTFRDQYTGGTYITF